MFRAPRGLLLPLAPAVLLAGTAAAQTYPVSGPFTPFLASDVEDFALTPDGSRAVYAADERKIGVLELFSVPAGGGPTLRLNQDLQAGQLLRDFEVSPDGEWVVYHVSDTTSETLWAARVGAEGTAVLLGGNAGKVPGDFQIGPNSRYVVYRDEFQTRLFSVPIDASRARVRLDPQLGPVTSFAFTADGSRVVYQVRTARLQLFSVPVDGSSVSVSLDDSVATWHTYLIGLHQDRAYFRDVATDAFYAVPVDGAAPPVTLATGTGQPVYCKLSPDGSTIVSLVDKVGLHAVATDGSTPLPVSLAEGFVRGDFLFTSDGDRVVYRRLVGGDADLFAVRLSDERVVRLTSGFHAWEIHDGSITPDGAFAVFEHLVDTVTYPRVYDLYSVAIEGGAVPRKLNGPLVPGETVLTGEDLGFRISADGARVTYIAAQEVGAGYQLFAAPVAGGAPATLLDGGPRPNRTVTSLVASPVDEEVYFVADEELPTAQELFRVPADGSAPASRVSTALMGTNRGDVREFQLSPDESRVVYLADQDLDDRVELYSARTDGSGEAIRLNGPLPFGHDVLDFRITPDSEHVAFSTGGTFLGPLFGVPIDGGRPPSLLTPSYRLSYPYFPSPDGEVIVFPGPFFDFFAVPVDGSGPPVQISDGGAGGSLLFVNTTRLFPDGRGVVHRGPNRTGMVAAPLDGSAPPIELTGSTRKGAGDFHLTEDDDLLFIQEDGRFDLDLFLVPVDGSQAVVQVSDPAVDGRTRSLPFEHVPIADRVVYQKDDGLFMRPLDLGVPPVRLSPPGAGVYEWAVGPRGRRVAYSSGTDLFVTPITHSDPVGVSEPFGRFLGVTELAFTADGRRILFLGKRNSSTHLYVAPTGTAGGAIRLDRETNVFAFDLRPDSDRVVYLGERTQGKVQVYEVPVDGHRRRNRVSKRPAGLAPPVLSSEASAVLYLGTDVLAGYLDLLVHRFGPGAFTWSPEPR